MAETLLEIGKIARPHGLKGELEVWLSTNRTERLIPGSVVYTSSDQLIVKSSSSFKNRWLVRFEGVTTRDQAESLKGVIIFAPKIEDNDSLWVHDLIGSQVEDLAGSIIGTVKSVEANPASDLLVLEDDTLIPLVFVKDQKERTIVVDLPAGLLE